MQNLPIKFQNKKGILVSTPTLLKYMSLFLNKFKLGFGSDTYLPFGPKSRFLLFFFFDVIPKASKDCNSNNNQQAGVIRKFTMEGSSHKLSFKKSSTLIGQLATVHIQGGSE